MKKRTNEEYVELLKLSNKFKSLQEYQTATKPILHKCLKCKYEWSVRPQQLLRPNSGCPSCTSWKNSQAKVNEVLNSAGLEALTIYTGSLDPITLKHLKCGNVWTTKYSYIQQGSGCPSCNIGFGYKSKDNLPEVAFLYVLNIITYDSEHFLKVGITSQQLNKRINSISSEIGEHLLLIKPILVVKGSGENILKLEKSIHANKDIVQFLSKHKFDGYTETKRFEHKSTIENIIKGDNNVEVILTS